MANKSIDLILTDPPYGKIWTRGSNGIGVLKDQNENDSLKWDKIPPKEYFEEILRVGKKVIIWGGNYFTNYLYPSNCWLVWDKRGTFPRGKQIPFADCELAWTSENKTVKKFTLISQGFVTEVKEKRVHPTQKPLELFKWCIEQFTNKGDSVLDPFMGSGTTIIACEVLGRDYIGIEIEPKYIEVAKERLAQIQLSII